MVKYHTDPNGAAVDLLEQLGELYDRLLSGDLSDEDLRKDFWELGPNFRKIAHNLKGKQGDT